MLKRWSRLNTEAASKQTLNRLLSLGEVSSRGLTGSESRVSLWPSRFVLELEFQCREVSDRTPTTIQYTLIESGMNVGDTQEPHGIMLECSCIQESFPGERGHDFQQLFKRT